MRDIDRIIFIFKQLVQHVGVLVAVLTYAWRDTGPYAQVLLVTANAKLHTHRLSGRGEFGFHKLGHRMPIIGIIVARQTLVVARWGVDKILCGI